MKEGLGGYIEDGGPIRVGDILVGDKSGARLTVKELHGYRRSVSFVNPGWSCLVVFEEQNWDSVIDGEYLVAQ